MFARSFGRFFRRRLLRALPVLALALTRCYSFARAGSVEVVGAIGGRITQEETNGAITYVARGLNLEIEQSCTDGNTYLLSRLHMPGFIQSFERIGPAIYVGVVDHGLFLIDSTDPAHPRMVQKVREGGRTFDLFSSGSNLIYASGYKGRIFECDLFDASNPLNPVKIDSECGGGMTLEHKAYLLGSKAFYTVGKGPDDSIELNICNPGPGPGPKQGGSSSLELPTRPTDVLVEPQDDFGLQLNESEEMLYIILPQTWTASLSDPQMRLVVDVANPELPKFLRTEPNPTPTPYPVIAPESTATPMPTPASPSPPPTKHLGRALLRGELAYINDPAVNDGVAILQDSGRLVLVDVADPAHPRIRGSFKAPDSIYGMAISGSFTYLCTIKGKMHILDTSDLDAPKLAASVEACGTQIRVSKGHAYLWDAGTLSGCGGIEIFDLSNPEAPRRVGTYDHRGDFAVSGTTGILADGTVHVLDLSDPANPKEIASMPPGPTETSGDREQESPPGVTAEQVVMSNSRILARRAGSQPCLIDVSDPRKPIRLWDIDDYKQTLAFAISPHWACRAFHTSRSNGSDDGISFDEIPDGSGIEFRGICPSSLGLRQPISITATGNDLFYVTDGAGGLVILRPSTADNPQPEVIITTAR